MSQPKQCHGIFKMLIMFVPSVQMWDRLLGKLVGQQPHQVLGSTCPGSPAYLTGHLLLLPDGRVHGIQINFIA